MARNLILSIIMLMSMICSAKNDTDTLRKRRKVVETDIVAAFLTDIGIRNSAAAALSYSPIISLDFRNDFLLKDLMYKSISAQIGISGNHLTFNIMHYGYPKYGEYRIAAGYSRIFGKKFALGMNFFYIGNHAQNYGVEHSITLDITIYCNITKRIGFGARAFNPVHLKYGISGEGAPPLPMIFNIDFHYKISRGILVFIFAEKEIGGALRIGVGGTYSPLRIFRISMHAAFPTPEAEIRTLFCWNHIELGAGVTWKTNLGITPCLTLNFPLKKNKR